MKRVAVFLMIAAVSLAYSPGSMAQCPMCKTALKSNQTGKKGATVGNGINKGILFLLSAPYLLVGAAGFAWYRYQKNRNNA